MFKLRKKVHWYSYPYYKVNFDAYTSFPFLVVESRRYSEKNKAENRSVVPLWHFDIIGVLSPYDLNERSGMANKSTIEKLALELGANGILPGKDRYILLKVKPGALRNERVWGLVQT